MKKLFLVLVGFLILNTLSAQDVILKKNGDEISAKIQEVGVTDIKYKKFENPDGPMYTILKSEVMMIKYQNGTKDVFPLDNNSQQNNNVVAQPVVVGKAKLIVYHPRTPNVRSMVYDIYVDNSYLTKVNNNSYFETELTAGSHTFTVQNAPQVTTTINLEPDKTYYLRCYIKVGFLVNAPFIEFVSESIAVQENTHIKK